MAQEYHQRIRNEHKQELFNQMNTDKNSKLSHDRAMRQDDADQAQKHGIFNSQFE